jgi:EAL domain-containing protein (putative c-di-GMP-specific phosphodiesterase class I)
VETAEQVERLRDMGCDYIQGFYYSRPLPQADFEAYLQKE